MPRLSIIIPTFNSARTITECLESICRQTLSDLEILVQDGCSKDNTAEIVDQFAKDHPTLALRLFEERDTGVYDAMNKAVARANGEWLYFLGSDDKLHDDDVLRSMLDSPDALDGDVLYGNVKAEQRDKTSGKETIYDGRFDRKKLLQRNICHQAILYRHSFANSVGPYNMNYKIASDWDYNLRCWPRTRFRYLDVIVADFGVGGLSTSGQGDKEFLQEVTTNVMTYFGWSMFHPALNSWDFVGCNNVIALQRSRSPFHEAAGKALRTLSKLQASVRRSLGAK